MAHGEHAHADIVTADPEGDNLKMKGVGAHLERDSVDTDGGEETIDGQSGRNEEKSQIE
jgi:hypothetical protein